MTLCFDIGGSFIKYGRVRDDGLVPELGRVPTPVHDFNAAVAAMREAIAEMGGAGAVSCSITGIVDPANGRSVIANVPCFDGIALEDALGAALDRPVRVTNDADCFALAEARLGRGRGHRNVFAIILGTGVGGGLVLNGTLVQGKSGVSGEWGHGPIVDPTAGGLVEGIPAFPCGCGRVGCLDTVGGARGMERLHAAIHNERRTSSDIISGWRAGDARAARTVDIFIEHIARLLGVMLNTLGATIVPVGGGLAASEDLIAKLDTRVRELALARYETAVVVPATRREDGGLVGAGLVASQQGARAA